MAGFGKEYIYAGIVEGLDKAVDNFQNIRQARAQEEERKKKADIDFKISKLKLQQVEAELDPDVLEARQTELKLKNQALKVTNQLNVTKIKEAETKAKQDVRDKYREGLIFNTMIRPAIAESTRTGRPLEIPPGLEWKAGDVTVKGPTEKSAFGGEISEKERTSAIGQLISGYAKSIATPELAQQESLLDKLPLGTSSKYAYAKEIAGGKIKGKLGSVLGNLGITKDELFDWAMNKNPDLARAAFPAMYEARKGR